MRLINADKLGLTDFEILMCNGDYKEALKMLIDKIDNAPTAYDVNTIINKLQALKNSRRPIIRGECTVGCTYDYDRNTLDKAIEIVKGRWKE